MTKSLPVNISDGIYIIDTNYLERKKYAASYIMVDNNEAAIIETNTNFAIPKILEGLKHLNINREDVKYIILTHIHLDHAGGAGLLIQELPNAKLILHPRGKKHLSSPEKLIESVKAVYGEEAYRNMYGDILPIQKNRMKTILEEEVIKLGNRELLIFETQGHAKHHISILDKHTKSLFSGDSFGIGYPIFCFKNNQLLFPSSSPTQFDPETAIKTIDKFIDLKPNRICLTHFGAISNIESAANQLKDWINFLTKKGNEFYMSGLREKELSNSIKKEIYNKFETYVLQQRDFGLTDTEKELLEIDFDLNSQGVAHYIKNNQ